MHALTSILSAIEHSDPKAAGELLPLVYDELRKLAAQKLAREPPGQTLQPTALVHKAYLRLVGDGPAKRWSGRGHFFAPPATAIRHILIERARRKRRQTHGGRRQRRKLHPDLQSVKLLRWRCQPTHAPDS
jgi:RNA polymerase sigma factor (TIGR02999 family)